MLFGYVRVWTEACDAPVLMPRRYWQIEQVACLFYTRSFMALLLESVSSQRLLRRYAESKVFYLEFVESHSVALLSRVDPGCP